MIAWDQPATWAVVLFAIGLGLMVPNGSMRRRAIGAVVGLASLACFSAAFPVSGPWLDRAVFRILALIAVGSAAASVSMRNAVYAAVWFAICLLGVAGLFLYQGAQFLGVVTVVVYAGAIVVTFLFVIMLAQPTGQMVYDRITWGGEAKILGVGAGALLVAIVTGLLTTDRPPDDRDRVASAIAAWDARTAPSRSDGIAGAEWYLVDARADDGGLRVVLRNDLPPVLLDRLRAALPHELESGDAPLAAAARKQLDIEFLSIEDNVLHPNHVALLGRNLYGRHLISVEIAGTVLLAALVGAIAVAMRARRAERPYEGEAA
ncbi:MAG: hypothetical protein FJ297_01470 [Planctomycetes bacterium]|nr:hypothetical protein [Planctomycetota bacterium]